VGRAILIMAEIRRDVKAVLTAFAPVLASFSLRDVVEEPLISSGPASVPENCWDSGRAREARDAPRPRELRHDRPRPFDRASEKFPRMEPTRRLSV